ncbi:unnamed protein product [Rotaria sp. Silwood1]|nr:unnamed protein product [Rotaria sp. Silwood1]CAF4919380.1 unnamed protein product [Rotaria sp. Silwood1]
MSREQSATDKKEFCSFVLHLKQIHPLWKSKDITNFLIQSENLPSDTAKSALNVNVWRILNRNQVNNLPRSGAPRTTITLEYIQAKGNKLYDWAYVLNADFSGIFTLSAESNQHNEAEKANKESGDLRYIIFQDDEDRQQRMRVALNAVEHVFHHRIEPKDCAAK